MTTNTEMPADQRKLTFTGDLDVPEWVPRGIDLGRINNKEQAFAKFGKDYVERHAAHALLADDYAYQAVLDIKDKSNKIGWKHVYSALEHGLDSLDDPPPGVVALFEEMERIPSWVDFDQIYRGAVAFWRAGPIVPPVLAWGSIAGGFSMYGATRPVLFSGRLKDPKRVGPRLTESFRYIVAAYEPGAMDRYREGFRLTAKVRLIHAAVRYGLSRSDNWDWENWGIPINDLDGMATQAGQFGIKFTNAVQSAGIRYSDQELEDILALSRYVGFVIGVPESLLHTSYEDALKKIDLHYLLELPPDDKCRDVISSILQFSIENPPGDVDPLPAPLAKFMTDDRRLRLAYGLLHSWIPPHVMRELNFEKTAWRHLLPAARPLISAVDRISRILPHDDEKKAFTMLKEFNSAIEIPDGSHKNAELADPDELVSDITANKGGMTRLRRSA